MRDSGFQLPAAGKTGTTNEGTDAWFVGYTPEVAASVWIGFDQNRPILEGATGGRLAAPLWGRVMARAYQNRQKPRPWQRPAEVVSRPIDPATGLVLKKECAGDGAPQELFVEGLIPASYCPGRENPPRNGFPAQQQQLAEREAREAEEARLAKLTEQERQEEQEKLDQIAAARRKAEEEARKRDAAAEAERESVAKRESLAELKAREEQQEKARIAAARRQAEEETRSRAEEAEEKERAERERVAAQRKAREREEEKRTVLAEKAREEKEEKEKARLAEKKKEEERERAKLEERRERIAKAEAAADRREKEIAAKEKELRAKASEEKEDKEETRVAEALEKERRARMDEEEEEAQDRDRRRREAREAERAREEDEEEEDREERAASSDTDLSGWWEMTNTIQSTNYADFKGLRLGYRIQLEQDGDRLVGRGQKWSENGRTLPASARTPLSVTGTIDGDRVILEFKERGAKRTTGGSFSWTLSPDRTALRGSFQSTAADTSGSSLARRMP